MNFELEIRTEEELEEITRIVRLGMSVAREAEALDEELLAPLKMSLRLARLHFKKPAPAPVKNQLGYLKTSKWFDFWNTELRADLRVRWTKHPNAEYTVVTGDLVNQPPAGAPRYMMGSGPWIELRRASGKTFLAHVGTIRPIDWKLK